jgi:2-polyprenyl-3-methyl-5-hydroxy-6-metoxy-1,4-benzoquinol methylase
LNDTHNKNKWVTVPSCKIVILSEVIEHLYTSPKLVLEFVKSFLENNGLLIIQTPNAVSLDKRLMMVRGRNFMELIRENDQNPGHFREYTKNELFSLAEMCSLKVADFTYSNYFNLQPVTYKVIGYRLLQKILGKSFMDGMTVVLKKMN